MSEYGPAAPVPVFQHEAEFAELLDLYRARKPRRVLEIGTYHGGTLYHWLQNAAPGTTVVSLDSYAVGVDNRTCYSEWVPEGVTLEVIEGDSRDPATVGAIGRWSPYEWIFIDAGHWYAEVKSDWDNYSPMCVEGGVVCFHDILDDRVHHPEIEVAQLWREIKNARERYAWMEIVNDPDAWWGGIGICFM